MDAFPTFNERTVFVTRSVDRQEFRLRPDTKVNEAIKYLLMVISKRYKLSPHCICALSNHLHSILTDPEAKFPAFLSDFHSLITKCVNHIYGDTGSLWDKKQTNRLYLDDVETIKKQVGYTMANPVAAGLVEEGTLWPGVRACWPAEKEVISASRLLSSPWKPCETTEGLAQPTPARCRSRCDEQQMGSRGRRISTVCGLSSREASRLR